MLLLLHMLCVVEIWPLVGGTQITIFEITHLHEYFENTHLHSLLYGEMVLSRLLVIISVV